MYIVLNNTALKRHYKFNDMAVKYFSFKIDHSEGKKLKDKTSPVTLVIRKEGQRKKIYLGISVASNINKRNEIESQWDEKAQRYETDKRKKELHPDRDKNNSWLNELSVRCENIVEEFEKNRIDWTLNQFEQAFLNKTKKTGIEAYFLEYIKRLDRSGNIGNKLCYEQCLNMLKKYDVRFSSRVFPEIDLKYVEGFNVFLDERGQCGNTKKYYIKTLRAILNKAIKEKECSAASYPFGKDGFSIAALVEETSKRYLPAEYLERLKNATLKSSNLNWCRNLFLFSYFTQGMSFVDAAHLKSSTIVIGENGRYIKYKRQKLEKKYKRFITIKITENIQSLLDWAKVSGLLLDDYLLPIITRLPKDEPVARKVNKLNISKPEKMLTPEEQLYMHIKGRYKRYNNLLKDLAHELEFEGIKLSTYMSRHSYAMKLKNSGISEDIISEALGHQDLMTTRIYLDSFQNGEVEKANEVL